MSEENLLNELSRAVRSRESASDPVWERLARGELSAREQEELRARSERDPEAALLYEAYRPLSTATQEKFADRLIAMTSGAPPKDERKGARVIPFRTIAMLAIPLAAAASFALFRMAPERDRVAMLDSRLPDFELSVRGGDRAQRSSPSRSAEGTVELSAESRVDFVFRPASAVHGDVALRAVIVENGVARPFSPEVERSADGAMRISGTAAHLFGRGGATLDIAFAIGRAGVLPESASAIASKMNSKGAPVPYQLLVTRVRVAGDEIK